MPHFLTLAASISLADPLGSSPLVAAVVWLQDTLLGTIATTVAILAVAWVGVMMLSGRVNLRHGATVVLGCFVLFGAATIAAGIRSSAENVGSSTPYAALVMPEPSPVIIPPARAADYDPYAGASVVHR